MTETTRGIPADGTRTGGRRTAGTVTSTVTSDVTSDVTSGVTSGVTSAVEAALAAYAPRVRPPVLEGGDVFYAVEETEVGRLLLSARADGRLLTCVFVPAEHHVEATLDRVSRTVSPRVLRGGGVLDPVRRQLAEYLAGRRRRFDVPVDLALATPFQREVLVTLAEEVGYGHTASYGRLARAVGRPSASRAVGGALNHNPVCVVVPCHRVVAGSGALTGYAGGIEAKRRLLELEAAGAGA